MQIRGPGGETWRVGRRWLPWRPRYRGRETDSLDIPIDFGDVGGILLLIGLVAAFFLLLTVLIPVLVLAAEVIVVVLVVLGATALRLIHLRPWRIEAATDGPPRRIRAWHVVGWRASGDAITQIADALKAGREPIDPPGATPVEVRPRGQLG